MIPMTGDATLFGAILAVGVFVYLGTIAMGSAHPLLRLITGYLCGSALILIGASAFYYGAAFEVPLVFNGAYVFETLHMGWIGLGMVALIVGALIVRQTYRRQ